MMTLPYRLGFISLILAAAFLSGFFYGRSAGRTAALESAVIAYQNRERIDHETDNLSPVDLCIAVGGLPDECTTLLRGVETGPAGE